MIFELNCQLLHLAHYNKQQFALCLSENLTVFGRWRKKCQTHWHCNCLYCKSRSETKKHLNWGKKEFRKYKPDMQNYDIASMKVALRTKHTKKTAWMFQHELHRCRRCSNIGWQSQLQIRNHSTPDEGHTQHMPNKDRQYLLFVPRGGQILVRQTREPEVGQVTWSEGFWAKQEGGGSGWGEVGEQMRAETKR